MSVVTMKRSIDRSKQGEHSSSNLNPDQMIFAYEAGLKSKVDGRKLPRRKIYVEFAQRWPDIDPLCVSNFLNQAFSTKKTRGAVSNHVRSFLTWYEQQKRPAPQPDQQSLGFDFSCVKGVKDLTVMLSIEFPNGVDDKQRAVVEQLLQAFAQQLPSVLINKAGVKTTVNMEVDRG